ncbi:MAG: acyltransferase [Gammaproteobacteria bacterium]
MNIFKSIIYHLSKTSCVRKVKYSVKYRRVAIDPTADVVIRGKFIYEHSLNIGRNTTLYVKEGMHLQLGKNLYIGRDCEISPNCIIKIGRNTSIQDRSIIVGNVSIGSGCLISYNVLISSGTHHYNVVPHLSIREQDCLSIKGTRSSFSDQLSVKIEDDCWIGINVVIMPGVIIGKGAVVGANSVVTKHVGPYTVVAGVPAKQIKKRILFSPPEKIHFKSEIDLPYFYSGFKLGLDHQSDLDGYATDSLFRIALSLSNAKTIMLRVRAFKKAATILFENTSCEINEILATYSFEISDLSMKFFEFSCNQESGVVVESAWLS